MHYIVSLLYGLACLSLATCRVANSSKAKETNSSSSEVESLDLSRSSVFYSREEFEAYLKKQRARNASLPTSSESLTFSAGDFSNIVDGSSGSYTDSDEAEEESFYYDARPSRSNEDKHAKRETVKEEDFFKTPEEKANIWRRKQMSLENFKERLKGNRVHDLFEGFEGIGSLFGDVKESTRNYKGTPKPDQFADKLKERETIQKDIEDSVKKEYEKKFGKYSSERFDRHRVLGKDRVDESWGYQKDREEAFGPDKDWGFGIGKDRRFEKDSEKGYGGDRVRGYARGMGRGYSGDRARGYAGGRFERSGGRGYAGGRFETGGGRGYAGGRFERGGGRGYAGGRFEADGGRGFGGDRVRGYEGGRYKRFNEGRDRQFGGGRVTDFGKNRYEGSRDRGYGRDAYRDYDRGKDTERRYDRDRDKIYEDKSNQEPFGGTKKQEDERENLNSFQENLKENKELGTGDDPLRSGSVFEDEFDNRLSLDGHEKKNFDSVEIHEKDQQKENDYQESDLSSISSRRVYKSENKGEQTVPKRVRDEVEDSDFNGKKKETSEEILRHSGESKYKGKHTVGGRRNETEFQREDKSERFYKGRVDSWEKDIEDAFGQDRNMGIVRNSFSSFDRSREKGRTFWREGVKGGRDGGFERDRVGGYEGRRGRGYERDTVRGYRSGRDKRYDESREYDRRENEFSRDRGRSFNRDGWGDRDRKYGFGGDRGFNERRGRGYDRRGSRFSSDRDRSFNRGGWGDRNTGYGRGRDRGFSRSYEGWGRDRGRRGWDQEGRDRYRDRRFNEGEDKRKQDDRNTLDKKEYGSDESFKKMKKNAKDKESTDEQDFSGSVQKFKRDSKEKSEKIKSKEKQDAKRYSLQPDSINLKSDKINKDEPTIDTHKDKKSAAVKKGKTSADKVKKDKHYELTTGTNKKDDKKSVEVKKVKTAGTNKNDKKSVAVKQVKTKSAGEIKTDEKEN